MQNPHKYPNAFCFLHIPLDRTEPIVLPTGVARPDVVGYSLLVDERGMYVIEPKILLHPEADLEALITTNIQTLAGLHNETAERTTLLQNGFKFELVRTESAKALPIETAFDFIITHLSNELGYEDMPLTEAPEEIQAGAEAIMQQLHSFFTDLGFEVDSGTIQTFWDKDLPSDAELGAN